MNKNVFLIGFIVTIIFINGCIQQDKSIIITPSKEVSNLLLSKCIPSGIKLSDFVAYKITVEQNLLQLKAFCRDSKLIDGSGREIYFYHLTGCWGNPPGDYQEILQKQQEEINQLKTKYTIIEMSCYTGDNPTRDIY